MLMFHLSRVWSISKDAMILVDPYQMTGDGAELTNIT